MSVPVVDEVVGLVVIEVIEAKDLPAMDLNGKADPYFTVNFSGKQVFKSYVHKKTRTPVFNEVVKIIISNSEKHYPVSFTVWDFDQVSKNDEIGRLDIDLDSVRNAKAIQDLWVPITNHKGKQSGLLHVKAQILSQQEVERGFWEEFARHFDTDKNGVINKTEFAVMAGSVHTELSDAEVAALFDTCDVEKQGEVSFERAVSFLANDDQLRAKWMADDPLFVWHVYAAADEYNDVASRVLNKHLLATPSFSPKKMKVILVHNRETGKLEEEKIPHYIEASLRAMYSNKSGRTVVDHSQIRKLLHHLSASQGKKFDDPRSKKEIPAFIKFHGLNVDEIRDPLDSFANFNEFFYRKLKQSARKIDGLDDPKVVVSPADCRLHVFSKIDDATSIWIKGKHFTLSNLLRNNILVDKFTGGSLVIARLAPQDYHRFHLPIDCTVGPSVPYDGALYTVNPIAINEQVDVYTENKRICTVLENPIFGTVAYISVGATMVGSIKLTSTEGQQAKKGDEHGYFAFGGSTVLLLFQPGKIVFDTDLLVNSNKPVETLVKMGNRIGSSPN